VETGSGHERLTTQQAYSLVSVRGTARQWEARPAIGELVKQSRPAVCQAGERLSLLYRSCLPDSRMKVGIQSRSKASIEDQCDKLINSRVRKCSEALLPPTRSLRPGPSLPGVIVQKRAGMRENAREMRLSTRAKWARKRDMWWG